MITLVQNIYLNAVLLVIGGFMLGSFSSFVIRLAGKKLAERTKTDEIEKVAKGIATPVFVLILMLGALAAAKSIPSLEGYSRWVEGTFFVVEVIVVAYITSTLISVLLTSWLKVQRRYEKTPRLLTKVLAVAVYMVAFLTMLSHFNINIGPAIATLGIGGLAVSLALQDTLKDFLAGIHIISDQPIRVGDFIQLEGAATLEGYVQDIGWRSTRIKTLLNTIIVLPNSKLAASTIINNSMPTQDMSLLVECGIDYGSNLEKVEKVTLEVARKIQKSIDGAVKDWEPGIRFHTFGDNNINFRVVLRIENFERKYLVRNEFIKQLHGRFKKEKIEISWPIRKVYDMSSPRKK